MKQGYTYKVTSKIYGNIIVIGANKPQGRKS